MAGVHKGSGHKGRPRIQHTATAAARFSQQYSNADIRVLSAWSKDKIVCKSSCSNSKHMRMLSCQRVTRCSYSLDCRICKGHGSKLEKLVYAILDQMPAVKAFAVEAYAVSAEIQHEGETLHVNRHSWDVMMLEPAKLLIEVQGEQHSSKLMTKPDCKDTSLDSRINRDHALATAAVNAGYHVLWLTPDQERNRRARWLKAIKLVLQQMAVNTPPRLHQY